AHQRSLGRTACDSCVPRARLAACRLRARLTSPCRSSTACTVDFAGMRTSPASRRTSSSRIFLAPQVLFVPLRLHDQPLDLRRQLVGIADWAPRAVAKRVHSLLPVPVPDLVAGLAGDAEFPAHPAHAVALQKTADKANSLVHNRTLLPRHQHLPKSEKCYLCVRYKTSP